MVVSPSSWYFFFFYSTILEGWYTNYIKKKFQKIQNKMLPHLILSHIIACYSIYDTIICSNEKIIVKERHSLVFRCLTAHNLFYWFRHWHNKYTEKIFFFYYIFLLRIISINITFGALCVFPPKRNTPKLKTTGSTSQHLSLIEHIIMC